ncbi:MAG: HNHc protein [Gammaproteobacteria bacterium]|nr:HNHc protein [Gammaproteobacteria bacterium]
MTALILRLDVSGSPVTWIPWQDAVSLYCRDLIAWTAGNQEFVFHGGVNRRSGERSMVNVSSIIAVKRSALFKQHTKRTIPPLTNRELFLRDAHLCMYCGHQHCESELTRDHVTPLSRGGTDRWSNVVTACRICNTRKGNRNPEAANMPLLAIPYVPNWAEYLALSNRKILADQMEFLKSQFSGRPMLFYKQ